VVKPFQKSDLLPQIEIALGRFREIQNLANDVKTLEDQLETRRVVERAKGMLMDEQRLKEAEAFSWIQKTAMRERLPMKEIARRVIDDGLRPPAPPAA
jgi:response regulator NasT